jgi:hypothetical protein
LWELGTHVLVGCADALTDDWISRAVAERQETVELAAQLHRDRQLLHLIRNVGRLVDTASREHAAKPPPPPEKQA